jgi:predicted enzyme related to lactoylglutathione lyase
MAVANVLAVISVSDGEQSRRFYERLFGKPADLNPMGSLHEWQLTDSGWVQVYEDAAKAGSSYLTLGVDDLDAHLAELAAREVAATEIDADAPMRLAQVKDPDGNMITFGVNLKGH